MRAVEDNNKLIAEFLGYTQPHPDYPGATYWYKKDESPLTLLLFDSDWNWLMEVVEKIESLNFIVYIETNYCQLYNATNHEELIKSIYSTKIESVYNACVEFIKWYNGQKQY